jgi:hypothetical protein
MIRNSVMQVYETSRNIRAIPKALLSHPTAVESALSAKTKIIHTQAVAASFMTTKAARLMLIRFAIKGLSSTVPKYNFPIAVVKQSSEPIEIRNKLGT